jgi:hypothetical protein
MNVFTFERAHTAPDAVRLATSRPILLQIRTLLGSPYRFARERPLTTVKWHGDRRCANRSKALILRQNARRELPSIGQAGR